MNNISSFFLSLNTTQGVVPSRIPILPPGKTIEGIDGRKWTIGDIEKLIKASEPADDELTIDINHSTDLKAPKGEESPAVGWFKNFQKETDGSVWADVNWNAAGQEAISQRKYRFISPAFLSNEKKEITQILRAALTNRPNLKLPALNSQSPEMPAKEMNMDKELCAALGLPETATKEEVLAAINARNTQLQLNAAKPQTVDLAVYAPRADLNAMQTRAETAEKKLADLNTAQLEKNALAAVEKAVTDRKIAPASKAEYLALCSTQAGLDQFNKIMTTTPEIIPASGVPDGTPPSDPGEKVELNADDRQVMESMGYTEKEYLDMKKAGAK